MHHVVRVESSFNPYAIGVVGGRLVRQPRNLPEAVSTARMLEQRDYNFSLGLAQVNRHNLAAYGLDSYEKAFQPCANLRAGSHILAECYQRSRDWGKAFSCYYSGDFRTGFRHGYVQKVYASMRGGSKPNAPAAGVAPIAVIDRVQRRVVGADPTGRVDSGASGTDRGQAASVVARRIGQYARGTTSTVLSADEADVHRSIAIMPETSVLATGDGSGPLVPPAAPVAPEPLVANAVSGATTTPSALPANRPVRVGAIRVGQGHPATAPQAIPPGDSAFVF
jgi:type IV secretion system protein VirB1